MYKNPYVEIIGMMQDEGKKYNPPTLLLGEIISAEPLIIKIGDLQLDGDNILIADYLLEGFKRDYSGVEGTDTPVSFYGLETVNRGVKQGDIVAVLPLPNNQKFIILCKVVGV